MARRATRTGTWRSALPCVIRAMISPMRLLAAFLMVGCFHGPYVTPQERCAVQGMAVSGMMISNGEGGATAVIDGRVAVASSRSYGEAVGCREPRREEVCAVRAAAASGAIKLGYNARARRVAIALGYLFLIVPGIVLDAGFSYGESQLESEAQSAASQVTCEDSTVGERDDSVEPQVTAVQARPTQPRQNAHGSKPLICLVTAGDAVHAMCSTDADECKPAEGREQSCVEENAGACFRYSVVISQASGTRCATTISTCEEMRAALTQNPDYEVTDARCFVYRQR